MALGLIFLKYISDAFEEKHSALLAEAEEEAARSFAAGARARMRVMVKRLLRKYGYPPDKTEHATVLALARAEVVCEEWAA